MKKSEFIIQVKTEKFGWCLLVATNAATKEQAERYLEEIESGKDQCFTWCREQYPTEEFRVCEIPHKEAWWTDDNWIG